jgi:hypothetical protein
MEWTSSVKRLICRPRSVVAEHVEQHATPYHLVLPLVDAEFAAGTASDLLQLYPVVEEFVALAAVMSIAIPLAAFLVL